MLETRLRPTAPLRVCSPVRACACVSVACVRQAGPIGFDAHGHPVVLERFGACQPAKLLAAFDAEAFMLHQVSSPYSLLPTP